MIKTESRNCLGQERIQTQMLVGKEGVGIVKFDPEPHTKQRFNEKIWWLNGVKPRKYPSRWHSVSFASASGYVVMDIASAILSDLESSEDQFLEF